MVAAKLHNYCIDMNEGESDILPRLEKDTKDDDLPIVIENKNRDPADIIMIDRPIIDQRN